MHCLVIQHLKFEDLGTFEPIVLNAGFDIEYVQAGVDAYSDTKWMNTDLAIVLGGPIGVNDKHLYPAIEHEIALIQKRIESKKPLLGICLGAQLIAAAMGAKVYQGAAKEIGWGPVSLTEAGKTSCLSNLADPAPVLHWHGDTFDLPNGATLLASTDLTPHQAFSVGKHILALQFHPEVDGAHIESWLIGHTFELLHNQIDPQSIRGDTLQFHEQATTAGHSIIRAWLNETGLVQ